MVEVKNLVKCYGDHTVLDHLSFTAESGQIYGFLGANGAGKTTTMNILTGYLGMTDGQVLINGHDITEESDAARHCIGYLPEQPPLYVDMTPKEYLSFAAELKGLPKADREDAVYEVMELTKITHMQNRLIKNLSKGYRQRVGLAQAILGFPEIIILDEPTVGLDPQQIIDIRNLIRSLAGKHTVILSSHILSEVQEVCDHILMIHHGKLVANGTPEELEKQFRDNRLKLVLNTDNTDIATQVLKAVDGLEIRSLLISDGECHAEVQPSDKESDIREAVFLACAEAHVSLLGMQQSSTSLEQVFLKLVNEESESETTQVDESVNNELEATDTDEAIPDDTLSDSEGNNEPEINNAPEINDEGGCEE